MKTLRRVTATLGAAVIAVGIGLVATPSPAEAHGALLIPGSRTYLCWVDGLQDNGQIIPSNPACADAVAQSGTTPLYNWFAVLDSNAGGATEGRIADGTICSAGNNSPYNFEPYSAARTDWPRTHLTSGGSIEMHYNNWASHPGRFDLYITENGWNPNAPLGWDDLEPEPFFSITDPPATGPPGGLNYYDFGQVPLPSGKSGLHIIVSHWIRSDSPENFYGCSDVSFDGGNGEVSGIGGEPTPPTTPPVNPDEPPTTPGPPIVSNITQTTADLVWGASGNVPDEYEVVNIEGGVEEVLATVTGDPPESAVTLTGLTPDTQYEVAIRASNENGSSELSDGAPFPTLPEGVEPTQPTGDCTVAYDVMNEWGSGFQSSVTVTNDSGSAVNGWDVGWTFPGNQEITQLWSGNVSQSGNQVTVSNASWNLAISPGASVTFGFLGTVSGANDEPSAFTLNGAACAVG